MIQWFNQKLKPPKSSSQPKANSFSHSCDQQQWTKRIEAPSTWVSWVALRDRPPIFPSHFEFEFFFCYPICDIEERPTFDHVHLVSFVDLCWSFCIWKKVAPIIFWPIPWVVPLPRMPFTTRIITFWVGDSYKPLFATVTGQGATPNPYPYQLRLEMKSRYSVVCQSSAFWLSQKIS